MKKLTALLLAVVMVFGMAAMVSADFTDAKSISTKYQQAVFAMSDKGVITGFEDGSFKPKDTLTRAQAAKIICTMMVGENVPDGKTEFADVPAGHWAEKYVAYCAKEGIVAGVGAGKFNPNGKLTGLAFGKMLLVANGHDPEKEGLTGAGWDTNTATLLSNQDLDYNLKVTNDPMERQEACQMAYNFTLPTMDKSKFEEVTLSMKDNKGSYKVYGRTILSDAGLETRFSTSGIEFTANLAGDLTLTYTSGESDYLRVYVDGMEIAKRVQATQSVSPRKLKIPANIRSGEHSVLILKDGDISKADSALVFQDLTFNGEKVSVSPAYDRPLFIEYVGDSITAGKYVLSKNGETDDSTHSGVYGYAYLASQLLDADWMLTARGGIGFQRTTANGGSCPITMAEAYDYVNPFAEDEAKVKYDFARKPDVVVIALGTNDNADKDVIKAEAKKLVEQIKDRNGADVKIVIMAGMMSSGKNATLEEFAKENGLYFLKVTPNSQGGKGHPNIEGQAKNAQELADYLKTILK